MKKITYIFIISLFLSCNNERVLQLPEIKSTEITEVLDVSPIYIFYDETQSDSTLFNRNNLIGSTNWLVNIDKRLSLKQIFPHIEYLQRKRKKASMHNNENAKNYFTCNDTSINNIGFVEFTDLNYTNDSIADFITELYVNPSKTHKEYYVNFLTSDSLVIGNQTYIEGLNKMYLIETLRDKIKNDTLKPKIHLTFKQNLSFQDYISFKSEIFKLNKEPVEVSKNEFIY
jgi:hypothetical protein